MEPDIQVVGEAEDAPSALALVERCQPDILLLDINMPGGGLEVARCLAQGRAATRVVALTIHDDQEYLAALVRLGVRGYVLKDEAPQRVVSAIREVADGGAVLPPKMMARFLDRLAEPRPAPGAALSEEAPHPPKFALSPREQQVLEGIVHGKSNREIAQDLFISEKTVKNHVTNLLAKLHVQDRTQAAVLALSHGLVQHPPLGPKSQAAESAAPRNETFVG